MKANQFNTLADHYDALMQGVPYKLWVDYIEEILERLGVSETVKTVLDAACGTGTVSELLNERGFDVTGVDLSAPMVEVAIRKAEEHKLPITYHVQDLAELDLPIKDFDLIVSLFDSLNYITDPQRLEMAINRIYEHLIPGGLFIFDVNTEYALAHGFFNQSNLGSRSYPKYIWHSTYERETRICAVDMTFEVMVNDEKLQFKETHVQRAHKLEELEGWLMRAGFRVLNVYEAYRFKAPGRRSDRVYFVARKAE